jgi:putative hydrolase of the HAD superfamily
LLIDIDDTILSACGRPEIACHIAAESAGEFGPIPPREVATAVLAFARNFWATAEAAWRLTAALVTR